MKESNKNKHLIDIGDICISQKYGVGTVTNVEYDDDCWYPISVEFKQDVLEFGQIKTKTKHCVYNIKGQTNSIDEEAWLAITGQEIFDAKFYKEINLNK